MRAKILGLIAGILLVGCSKDDNASAPEQDCNCNRVVQVDSFNMLGQYTFGSYITINDCTGVQKQIQWKYEYNKPKVGDCK
jgi:hypothetical protein